MRPLVIALLATAFLAVPGREARAQQLTIPSLDWRTVETRNFVIHYPRSAEAWSLDVARHIDAVHDAVSALVGNAPRTRVTVIVEDPYSLSNGFALPLLEGPVIFFWPVPPDPTSGIGDSRGWGELLSVHEYAHIAHLTWPSRNPWQQFLTRLSPLRLGPLAVKAPRWVDEGYATYIEGRLTGSGRPHGAWRAAVLREWALEGKLPTYAQLDEDPRFFGGSMAYLAGSAFIEWLVERQGDSSLVHLWKRMSARQDRTFSEAFAGVYGGYPDDLYGRFTAQLTGKALDVQRRVYASLGTAVTPDSGAGHTVQALTWYTGAPAVSRDGTHMAIVLARRDAPSRVVVWSLGVDTTEMLRARARRRLLARDPEDVPAISWRPPPRAAIATLFPYGGMAYGEPRFLPDGHRLLVVRRTGRGDGALRGDVFIWDFRSKRVRRVTHDAGIEYVDPAPDGAHAVADRCLDGICDVVRVDLATGALQTLAAGSPRVVYHRPRYSTDGARIAVSVQRDGHWRIAVLDAGAPPGTEPASVDPNDDANRYDAAFLAGDSSLVFTSDAGGIPNIGVMRLPNGEPRALTAVIGAAMAPEPDRASHTVYFLRLHAKGLDLASVPDTISRPGAGALATALAPATPPAPAAGDSFPAAQLSAPRAYRIGPRNTIVLPTVSIAAEGKSIGAMIAGTDPVGRLTWMALGVYGDRGTWRGASLGAQWRGWPASLGAETFYADEHPSRQHGGAAAPAFLDASYVGVDAAISLDRDYVSNAYRVRAGLSAGRLDGPDYPLAARSLVFAEYRGGFQQTPGGWRLVERVGVLGATGRTSDTAWARGTVSAAITVSNGGLSVSADAMYGETGRGAPAYEQFTVGGTDPPLYDAALASQRAAMPALPLAVAGGHQVATYRVTVPMGMLHPYFWAGSAGGTLDRWHQVLGIEGSLDEVGVWATHVPSMHVLAGVGYSLSHPVPHRTSVYLSVSYRP
ncbi:MAG TPA: hypothetical protein VIC55_08765 [Gemmatimonadaceae bacterium]|jgi:hypothetical protein